VSPDIRVRRLAVTDRVADFDCRASELNDWLRRYARRNAELDSARTHVALSGDGTIRGYVALTAGAVEHRDATSGMSARMPRYPLPVVVLARLAVDRSYQRRGVASILVRLAMEITVDIARQVGVRGLAVDADNQDAAEFYERLGFARASPASLKLQVPTRTLREQLGSDD
jgi:ribosomal protein S18 acetylase RimI-like enzyme